MNYAQVLGYVWAKLSKALRFYMENTKNGQKRRPNRLNSHFGTIQ